MSVLITSVPRPDGGVLRGIGSALMPHCSLSRKHRGHHKGGEGGGAKSFSSQDDAGTRSVAALEAQCRRQLRFTRLPRTVEAGIFALLDQAACRQSCGAPELWPRRRCCNLGERMAELRIRRLGYALGAQVTGVDLARPISDDMVAEIRRAWNQHIMLCFPGQNLDAAQMASACRRFGELDDNRHSPELRHPSHPDVMNVVNKPTARVGGRPAVNVTADLWHTDFSHHERPTLISLLLAKVLPDVGGDTMFANMYMAYDALSNTFKGLIDPLSAVHDYSLGPLYAKSSPEQQAKSKLLNPPVIPR